MNCVNYFISRKNPLLVAGKFVSSKIVLFNTPSDNGSGRLLVDQGVPSADVVWRLNPAEFAAFQFTK